MPAIPKGDPIALAEVQLKINGPRYSFTYPQFAKWKNIVMRLDEVAGEINNMQRIWTEKVYNLIKVILRL